MPEITYSEALNAAIKEEMHRDEKDSSWARAFAEASTA